MARTKKKSVVVARAKARQKLLAESSVSLTGAANLMQAVARATEASNSLPILDPKRHSQATLEKHCLSEDVQSVEQLLHSIASVYSGRGDLQASEERKGPDELFQTVTDASEAALEAAAALIDEATGVAQASRDEVERLAKSRNAPKNSGNDVRGRTINHIEKPQYGFYDWPIDNSDSPFTPRKIPALPSSSSSSAEEEPGDPKVIQAEEHLAGLHRSNRLPSTRKRVPSERHPFQREIDRTCDMQIELAKLGMKTPISAQEMPCDMNDDRIPWTFVDTSEKLANMMSELADDKDCIAVDLEHHQDRSFQGFTCLIQISSREADYVVDAIALRQYLSCLNEIFNDPAVVKVLHGANSDMGWLERDFGVYVVNLFDTGQAAKLLSYPTNSLSYLLEKHCSVGSAMKKMFQRSDWRIRPLPSDMMEYARQDTHFLLYIYDLMREELRQTGLLGQAWLNSKKISLVRYEKERFDPEGYTSLMRTASRPLSYAQRLVLRELYRWRDAISRKEDEGPQYVMSNRTLVRLAIMSPRIRTSSDLLSKLPVASISPLVRREATRLAELIVDAAKAVEKPRSGETSTERPKSSPTHVRFEKIPMNTLDAQERCEQSKDLSPYSSQIVSGSAAKTSALYSDTSTCSSVPQETAKFGEVMAKVQFVGESLVLASNHIVEESSMAENEQPSAGAPEPDEEEGEDSDIGKDVLPLSISETAKRSREVEKSKKNGPRKKTKSEEVAPAIVAHDYSLAPWKGQTRKPELVSSFNPLASLKPTDSAEGKKSRPRQGNVKPKSGQRSFTYRAP